MSRLIISRLARIIRQHKIIKSTSRKYSRFLSLLHNYLPIIVLLLLICVGCNPRRPIDSAQNDVENIKPEPTATLKLSLTENPPHNSEHESPSNLVKTNNESDYIDFEGPEVTFSISATNHTTPEGVFREVSFWGDAGGGCFVGCSTRVDYKEPVVVNMDSYSIEWWQRLDIVTCGWQPNEEVKLVLHSPNEDILHTQTQKAYSNGEVVFTYQPPINAEFGSYIVEFFGKSAHIQQEFSIVKPKDSRVYRTEDRLFLYNFQPREWVQVFEYHGAQGFTGGRLAAWARFQVTQKGQLAIQLDSVQDINAAYAVIGDVSGVVVSIVKDGRCGSGRSVIAGEILSPYELSIMSPTHSEMQSTASLWNIADYKDLQEPGKQIYEVNIGTENKWKWTFLWCAEDESTLRETLRPLSVSLLINDTYICESQCGSYSHPHIAFDYTSLSNGWPCKRWATILKDWPSGKTLDLEIRYHLEETIYDGVRSYPPGEYHQIIRVDVD